MQNIPDNVRTDMVSRLCESESVLSGHSHMQNISDNIRTGIVSLLCESVCDLSLGYSYSDVDNDFDLFFHYTISSICASPYVSAVYPNSKSSFDNKCRQTG